MVMNSRNSLPALNEMTTVQVMGQYSVSGADGRAGYSGTGKCQGNAGEIIPPAPPCFALRLRRAAGSVRTPGPGFENAGRTKRSLTMAGGPGVRFSDCKVSAGVRGCARLRLPTDVSLRATSVLMEEISRY